LAKGGDHGERVEREPITGVWGQSPQWGPGAEPLVRESGGRSPPEAEKLLAFGRSMEAAHLPTFIKYGNTKNTNICVFSLKDARHSNSNTVSNKLVINKHSGRQSKLIVTQMSTC